MKSVLFRVDGSHDLGMGHIVRCLALAEGLAGKKVEPVFVIKDYENKVIELVKNNGVEVKTIPFACALEEEASMVMSMLKSIAPTLVIFDLANTENMARPSAYATYFRKLLAVGNFMMAIDDFADIDIPFHVRIIPYYGAEDEGYRAAPQTKLLLGPAYFIFKREFIKAAKIQRVIRQQAKNILITMGGSDPYNLTIKVVAALAKVSFMHWLKLKIVIGPGYAVEAKDQIEKVLKKVNVCYEFVVGGRHEHLADLMLWADVAIIAGGLTKYETAVTGTPSISISPFERELQMCLKFERAGSLLHLGLRDRVDEETITRAVEKLVNDYHLRQEISNRGKKMVDGKGTERIIAEIPANLLN